MLQQIHTLHVYKVQLVQNYSQRPISSGVSRYREVFAKIIGQPGNDERSVQLPIPMSYKLRFASVWSAQGALLGNGATVRKSEQPLILHRLWEDLV